MELSGPDRIQNSDDRQADSGLVMSRHEERLNVAKEVHERTLRIRKRSETEHVEESVPRSVEQAEVERMEAAPDDSGEIETLPDGSISIPILEEELVVTTRTVVRERLIVRKQVHTEQEVVEADLRREVVEVDGDLDELETRRAG